MKFSFFYLITILYCSSIVLFSVFFTYKHYKNLVAITANGSYNLFRKYEKQKIKMISNFQKKIHFFYLLFFFFIILFGLLLFFVFLSYLELFYGQINMTSNRILVVFLLPVLLEQQFLSETRENTEIDKNDDYQKELNEDMQSFMFYGNEKN